MPESTILQIVRICVMFQSALFPICTTHSSLCLACAAEHHRAYLSATQGKAKPNLSTPLSCLLSIHRKPCPHIYCMANPHHAINIVVAPGLWLRGSSAYPPPRRLRLLNIPHSRYSGWEKHHQATGHEDTTYLPCLGTCG